MSDETDAATPHPIIATLEAAAPYAPEVDSSPEGDVGPSLIDDVSEADGAPSLKGVEGSNPEIVEFCAGLDVSDTDNAVRLIAHFGEDLVVMAQEGTAGGDWGAWSGKHWDFTGGAARATLVAQKVGDLIGLEHQFLFFTKTEADAIDAAAHLRDVPKGALSDEEKEIAGAAIAAEKALRKRKDRRNAHGVTTKNSGRIESMMKMAAPKLRRPVDAFNADRLAVACETHTLRFRRYPDADCGPDGAPRYAAEIDAREGHDRADLITALVPVKWAGVDAPAPKWRAFLDEMMPDRAKQRTVQMFSGLGLLANVVQYVMLHYGTGANGKSVFLEVISRVLGPAIAVGLPQESIIGVGDRAAGGASPDIARLWGKRFLRVNELKPGAPLQSDLVKRLTGGEAFPVRTLFKGYFEFQNVSSVHMSANGRPVIDGADYGIGRRALMVHWDKTVPEDRRRDFEEFVSELMSEAEGILAWLAEGARDFLANGLIIAESIQANTSEYLRDMDPFGRFVEACLQEAVGSRVQGRDMGAAYNAWAGANGEREKDMRQVGKGVKVALERRPGFDCAARIREIGGVKQYIDLKLVNVPEVPSRTPYPRNDSYGG